MVAGTKIEKRLDSGTAVELRPISFAAWRTLRGKLLSLVTERLVGALQKIAQGPLLGAVRQQLADAEKRRLLGEDHADPPAGSAELLRAALDELGRGTVEAIGEVLRDVGATLGEMADDFVFGCVTADKGWENHATAAEWMQLRDEAFKLSDPLALLEREKNFVRGVGQVLGQILTSSLPTPPGGSTSNT